ncbi:hypothetical protein Btru_014769 [Bulinus truncatus]|nr:hypothetical protein Btru_014769 [Bulinus truncatus]
MLRLLLAVFLMVTLGQVKLSAAAGTTMGKYFLIALPKMNHPYCDQNRTPSVIFYLFTTEVTTFQVEYRVEWAWQNFTERNMKEASLRLQKHSIVQHECNVDNCNYRYQSGKKFTFSFQGPLTFGLCVLLNESPMSGAMITAIPVSQWGKDYFAVTLHQNPSVQITTNLENVVRIHIKSNKADESYTAVLKIKLNGKVYKDGSNLKVELRAKESIELSECFDKNLYGDLSGTYIRGDEPIGVVSGSCRSSVKYIFCDREQVGDLHSSDIVAEMLMPAHSFGKEFILFAVPSRLTTSQFMITAKHDKTNLTIYSERMGEDTYRYEIIAKARSTLKLNLLRRASYSLVSDKVIQVIHVMRAACLNLTNSEWELIGDPSFSLLVPNELFFYVYIWGTPRFGIGAKFFAAVIIRSEYKRKIYLNKVNVPFNKFKWDNVGRRHRWEIGEVEVFDGYNEMYAENYYYFGCYIYALGHDYGYMRPGGAIIAPIYDPDCQRTMFRRKINDLIDNDCDGRIDEEKEDGRDNDKDNEIDEDLGVVEDEDVSKYRGTLTTTVLPGTGCPPYTWGAGCSGSCINCLQDCVKWNGTCKGCKAGFTDAAHGCNKDNVTRWGAEWEDNVTRWGAEWADNVTRWGAEWADNVTRWGAEWEDNVTRWGAEWADNVTRWGAEWADNVTRWGAEWEDNVTRWGAEWADNVTRWGAEWADNVTRWGAEWEDNVTRWGAEWEDNVTRWGAEWADNVTRWGAEWEDNVTRWGAEWEDRYKYGKDCTGDCADKCEGRDCYERVFGECQACPLGYWGEKCNQTCFNCKGGCNVSYGTCQACLAGFKGPDKTCREACGSYEYGEGCRGNCRQKCKDQDCYERRFGECTKCPVNKWGLNCVQTCNNCKDDCDKSYGTCRYCKAGFKNPSQGCNISCGTNEFGEDCTGNCQQKCNKDCFERVYGSCSESGSWEEWHCSRSCSEKAKFRKRICAKPKSPLCDENASETKMSNCYVHGKCPIKFTTCASSVYLDCLPFTWDVDCVQNCQNCHTDCDKFNGSCATCKAGFKNPTRSCTKACDQYEYGEECSGDCRLKCKGKDCYERVNGTCIVDGQLSEWLPWKCKKDCESQEHVRIRLCNNPPPAYGGANCEGEISQSKNLPCLTGVTCPENCAAFTWGIGCNGSCNNCKTDCNKVDGSCPGCKAGFQNPVLGCKTECEAFHFGEDCLGDCRIQCAGTECTDKSTGAFNIWKYAPILAPLLFIPLCILFFYSGRKEKEEIGETTATAPSPYSVDESGTSSQTGD